MKKSIIHPKPEALSAVTRASRSIPGFQKLSVDFRRKVIINGYSRYTYSNYIRSIAMVSLGTGKLPTEASDEEIEQYLFSIKTRKNFSESYYKHTVWGLCMLFRMMNAGERVVKMPRIPKRYTLPVVLSKQECRTLLSTPGTLRDRAVLLLAYAGGLRLGELTRIRWTDIDFSRKRILVRAGKTSRPRYVVLSRLLIPILRKLRTDEGFSDYLFTGRTTGTPLTSGSIQFIIRQIAKRSGIRKRISGHILRHTFATHMLEDGVDLLSIKDQLGHSRIQNTILYTHVANIPAKRVRSPLDTLYLKKKKGARNSVPLNV